MCKDSEPCCNDSSFLEASTLSVGCGGSKLLVGRHGTTSSWNDTECIRENSDERTSMRNPRKAVFPR